jgi:DNA polymerase-3 subunit alpha
LEYEKEALGFYITGHPLNRFQKEIKRLSSYDTVSLAEASDGGKVTLAGLPTEVKEKLTKKGDRMAFVRLEDLKGSVGTGGLPQMLCRVRRSAQGRAAGFRKGGDRQG